MFSINTTNDGGGLAPRSALKSHKPKPKPELKQTPKLKNNSIIRLHNIKLLFLKMGWQKSYIESTLTVRDASLLEVETDVHFIQTYIALWYPSDALNMTFENIFKVCGLNKRTREKVLRVVTPLFNTCYGTRHLYDIAMEYLVDSLTIGRTSRPYCIGIEQPVNTWIHDDASQWFYNLSHVNTKKTVNSMMAPILHSMPVPGYQKHKLFYHATSWTYASKIITEGVSHQRGRFCLDFGESPSFYLTPDIHMAIEWCTKNRTKWLDEACILIYNINLEAIPKKRYKHFDTTDKDWTQLVTLSRQCQKNMLDECDYVYGPMAVNVDEIQKSNQVAKPHSPIKYQLASKTRKADRVFSECHAGTIYFKK